MSQLEVNKIIPQSGTTLTIGDSGDTISLPSGVSLDTLTITGDLTVDTDTLYVDSTNNFVGIGTASPVAKLHIQATAATSGEDLIKLSNGADAAELVIDTSANAINFKTGTGDDIVFLPAGTETFRINDAGNVSISGDLTVDTTTLKADTATGRVGVGTANPDNLLHVYAATTNVIARFESGDANVQILLKDSGTVNGNYIGAVNDDIYFQTNGFNERMRIDSSGNVGIGETTPSAKLTVNTNLTITNSSGNNLKFIGQNSGSTGGIDFQNDTVSVALIRAAGGSGAITLDADASNTQSGTYIAFDVDGSEAGRIDASGNLLFGDTSATANSPKMDVISASGQVTATVYRKTTNGGSTLQNWRSDVTATSDLKAEVEANGDLVNDTGSYTAFSDINLKQDIVDARSQWEDIKALQFKNFKLKKYVSAYGEDAPTHLGVIAQEVEASGMNGLVSENEDGTKYVKYSILYMKAVKALQEAMTRIESLETENTSIKARLETLENA